MDNWQKHVYNDCAAFVNQVFKHSPTEVTISLGQREAYVVMKALEAQHQKSETDIAELEKLCRDLMEWWKDAQYRVCGEHGGHNTFDDEDRLLFERIQEALD